jgi:cytochrome b pre-mRNA-processing protein 3
MRHFHFVLASKEPLTYPPEPQFATLAARPRASGGPLGIRAIFMKSGLFRRSPKQDSIHALYGAIVAQARSQAFYRGYAVPDTVTGRLEMILIHIFLFFRRARGGSDMQRLGQGVFDRFCDDMDGNLREMGIGDLAVPKHMQRIGEAFYGRAAVYDAALDADDDAALSQALARNVFGEGLQPERTGRLAAYIKEVDIQLAQEKDENLIQGRITFPDPESFDTTR